MSFLHLLFSRVVILRDFEAVQMMKRSHEQLRSLSLSVFMLTVPAHVASEVECGSGVCREASWDNTTWYYSEFEADAAGDGEIRLTAVDRYELWLNGTSIGSDDDWTTMETHQISVDRGTNEILVRVTSEGMGNGSGLLVELETGAQRTGTKVGNREEREGAWRWSSEDPDLAEVDWSKAPLVQSGTLDPTQIAGRTNPIRRACGGVSWRRGHRDPGRGDCAELDRRPESGPGAALQRPGSQRWGADQFVDARCECPEQACEHGPAGGPQGERGPGDHQGTLRQVGQLFHQFPEGFIRCR